MSKLYRSLLWSGLVVAGVAACGDDVTVAPPPNAGVQSVTVGPTGVTIAVNQTLQMAAAVNADAGVATTVTWTSSNPATATVGPTTGLVTGVAGGSVAITACSTVATGVCGQATVTVASSAPATISIFSITTGNTFTPVNVNAVAGQINVTLNLDAGSQNVSNVQVLIDGAVACQQGFSAIQEATAKAQAAVLASGDATADLVVQVICSVNTAAFDAITGVPTYLNGLRLLTARVNLVGSAPVATPSTSLNFTNASFIAVTTTIEGGSSATGSTGLLWSTGDVKAVALMVNYTSANPTVQQVVFSDLAGVLLPKTVTSPPYQAVWAKASSITGSARGSRTRTDPNLLIFAASTVNNQVGPTGTSAPTLRLDNGAPLGGTLTLPVQGSSDCCVDNWIGRAYNFLSGHGDPSIGVAGVAPSDIGVGIATTTYHIGPALSVAGSTDATTLAAFVAANAAGTTGTGADAGAETVTNADKSVVAHVADKLGNATDIALVALASPAVGFDLTDPTFDINAPPGVDFDEINFGNALDFQTQNSDNLSGFGPTPVRRKVYGNFISTGFSQATCWGTVSGTSGNCNNVTDDNQTLVDYIAGLVDGVAVPAGTTLGEQYFTYEGVTRDKGGNRSAAVIVNVLEDLTPPVSSNIAFPGTLVGGSPAAFGATLTDNVDLASYQFRVGFGAGTIYIPSGAATVIGAFGAPILKTATANASASFVRAIEDGVGGPVLNADEAFMRVTDVAGNFSTQLNNIAVGTYTPVVIGDLAAARFVSTFAITQSDPLCTEDDPADCVNPDKASVTLTATAVMTNNTANNPFPKGVQFFRRTPAGDPFPTLIGSATSFSVTVVGGVNVYSWKVTLTGAALAAATAYEMQALGSSATGVGLLVTAALTTNP